MDRTKFKGKFIFLGFGSITVGSLHLFLKHFDINSSKIHIITKETNYKDYADALQIPVTFVEMTRDNYRSILDSHDLDEGDFVVNLSVSVSSKDVMLYCQEKGAFYLDTCVEEWEGFYTDYSKSRSQRSNYAMRDNIMQAKEQTKDGPTAIIAHGANPGMVNHFVKRALVDIAQLKHPETIVSPYIPLHRSGWADFARQLGVKVIQISERDTQTPKIAKKRNEFVNTWSIDGFIAEGIHQPAELGWGTHEETIPEGGAYHNFGCQSAIYINQPGASLKVRGWTPMEGSYHGFMVTHNESIGIADYFTKRDKQGDVEYRPTVYYCYHPCDAAVLSVHEILGREANEQTNKRLIMEKDIEPNGVDELGVLLLGDFGLNFNGYWHGSRLTIEDAMKVPKNNATSLQVCASVLAGVVYVIKHPKLGLVEPDDLDYREILAVSDPYTETIVSQLTKWTPGDGRFQINDFVVKYT